MADEQQEQQQPESLVQALALLSRLSLPSLAEDARFRTLDKQDSYYSGDQYNHLKYDWDGRYSGYGDQADIRPGWFVPLKHRRPSLRLELPRLVVNRYTAMLLGEDSFPDFSCPGDSDTEDYVKALIEASKFKIKLAEARDKGGASGTAVMSFCFVDGKPQVEVHRAKHIKVLAWKDRYEFRPSIALKVYCYHRDLLVEGKPKRVKFFFVRLWTENTETLWNPVPEDLARDGSWLGKVKSFTAVHDYGSCPVYWAQNLPDSDTEDGYSDFEGLGDDFDELNRLLSATVKGTVANVDPTLVVKMDPGLNHGAIKKGSDNAIFSAGGAEYLELNGTSIKTAMELAKSILQYTMDVTGVVLPDPAEISGASRSAAAMKVLYMPMANQCDKLRVQYGDGLAIPLLLGMLNAARKLTGAGGVILTTEDGRRVQERPVVKLPPRITTTKEVGEDGSETESTEVTERKPGTGETLVANWKPYFPATAQDNAATVDMAVKAKGVLVAPDTATKAVAGIFNVTDIEAELVKIEAHKQLEAERLPGLGEPGPGEQEAPEEEGAPMPGKSKQNAQEEQE